MFRYFYIVFAIILLWIVVLVNKLLPVPFEQKQEEVFNPNWTKLNKLENTDSLSFELVYKNLQFHFSKPVYQDVLGGLYLRDDKSPEEFYITLSHHENHAIQKYGKFGLALIYKNWENYELMLNELNEIEVSSEEPYYYNELGWALLKRQYYNKAVEAFTKELHLVNGNHSSANQGLAETLHEQGNYDAIHEQMTNELFVSNCPDYILNKELFLHGPIYSYLAFIFNMHGTWEIVSVAFLISLLWGYYYTRFKIFDSKDYTLYIIVFLVSCIITPCCIILYNTYYYIFNFYGGQGFLSELIYMILGVGIIEEFTKTIPVIVSLVIFRKRIKEPVDYLLFATCSALGFAFMENIIYFNKYFGEESFSVIHKRTVLTVIMHIFCSVIIWYGFIRTKLSGNIRFIVYSILVSITTHGLYDFFLELPTSEGFYLFSFIMVVLSFFALKAFYNSVLNQSPLFDPSKLFPTESSSFILVIGLCFIILFEFILDSIRFGAPHANDSLMSSLLAYIILVVIYSSNFARIILSRNHWIKIKSIFSSNYSAYRTVGCEVVLFPLKKSNHVSLYPLYGKIVELKDYNERPDNYVIQLSSPIQYNNHSINQVLVSAVSSTNVKHKVHAKLYYQSNQFDINIDGDISSNTTVLLDYCLLETAVEKSTWFFQITWNWKAISFLIGAFLLLLFSFVRFMNYSTSIDYYRAAEKSLSKLDIYTASVHCRSALHFNENNYEARMLFAKIRMDGGFYQEALKYLNVDSSIPDYIAPDYYAVEGMAYYKLNNHNAALRSFLKCEDHTIKFDSLYWYKSCVYEINGNEMDAIKSMRFFLADKKHESILAYLKIGDVYMSLKQYREAYFYFDALIKQKEFYAHAMLQRGLCNYYLNNREQGCIDLETAHSYNDPHAIQYLNEWCRVQSDTIQISINKN